MSKIGRISLVCSLLLILMVSIASSSSVRADTIEFKEVKGPILVAEFNTTGPFVINLTVDHNSDVYLVDKSNLNRFVNGTSYGYIQEKSDFNKTEFNISGEVPKGTYGVIVKPSSMSNISINEIGEPSHQNNTGPWLLAGVALVTAVVTVLVTYFLPKWIKKNARNK